MAITPVLITHISAGSLALICGAAALFVRKGERLHRAFGTVFFPSMMVMAATGAYLAASIPVGFSALMGILTFYLAATAWMTVRRREGSAGAFERIAFLIGSGIAAAFLLFGVQAANSPKGALDGYPAAAYFVAAAVVAMAAGLDLKVALRGGISGVPRIARHLWRTCLALFVASGSFFLGQQKVMPAFMHGSPVLVALAIAPLVLMLFWLFRVRFTNWFKRAAVAT